MARQVSFVTRTDCTQPSSRAISPRSAECWTAPTEPPGLGGVERGDPTVPKTKPDILVSLDKKAAEEPVSALTPSPPLQESPGREPTRVQGEALRSATGCFARDRGGGWMAAALFPHLAKRS